MPFIYVGDKPSNDMIDSSLQFLNELDTGTYTKVGIIAIDNNGDMTAIYHNMGFKDRLEMAALANADAIDMMIRNNRERYTGIPEEELPDLEDDGDVHEPFQH